MIGIFWRFPPAFREQPKTMFCFFPPPPKSKTWAGLGSRNNFGGVPGGGVGLKLTDTAPDLLFRQGPGDI